MQASVRAALADALGSEAKKLESVGGGCISDAYACYLADGRKIFVKTRAECEVDMFRAEASGLAWLAAAGSLRTPAVLAVGDSFLALEFVESAPACADFDQQFGSGLASLHQAGADTLGLAHPGYLATLPQDNRASPTWAEFYVERRLQPLIRRALDKALVPATWSSLFDPLFTRMPEIVGDEEDVARLHGDLWSGNVHTDAEGKPVLIDPAPYGGNREIDLAMLKLFGHPSDAFERAYQDHWPLEHGYLSRVELYQLYPLLAHVNLFGGSYVAGCERVAKQYR
jgi:fructosamine-3-kinase